MTSRCRTGSLGDKDFCVQKFIGACLQNAHGWRKGGEKRGCLSLLETEAIRSLGARVTLLSCPELVGGTPPSVNVSCPHGAGATLGKDSSLVERTIPREGLS